MLKLYKQKPLLKKDVKILKLKRLNEYKKVNYDVKTVDFTQFM